MAAKTIQFPTQRPGSSDAHVISAAPIVALLGRVRAEAEALTVRAPQSDLASCTRSFETELADALKLAKNTAVYVTIEALAEIIGRPVSTLRRVCGKHRAAAGAEKIEGVWSIHLPTFQEFLKRGDDNLEEVA